MNNNIENTSQNNFSNQLGATLENCLTLSRQKEDDEIELTKSERIKSYLYRRWRLSSAFLKKHGLKIAMILAITAACAAAGYVYLAPKFFELTAISLKSLIPNIGFLSTEHWWTSESIINFINTNIITPIIDFKAGITGAKLASTALGGLFVKAITGVSGFLGFFLGDKLVRSPSEEWKYQKNTEALRGFKENDFDYEWIYTQRMSKQIAPLVQALDRDPALLNMQDSNGNTLLDYAIEAKDVNLIKKLKKMGANFDRQNKQGLTPRKRLKNIIKRLKNIIKDRHLAKKLLPPKKAQAPKKGLLSFIKKTDKMTLPAFSNNNKFTIKTDSKKKLPHQGKRDRTQEVHSL